MSLANFFTRTIAIRHSDEDMRRRGRNVVWIALGLLLLLALAFPAILRASSAAQIIPSLSVIALLLVGTIILAVRGRVTEAGLLLVMLCLGGVAAVSLANNRIGTTPIYFILSLLVAGATMRPIVVGLLLLLDLAVLAFVIYPLSLRPQELLQPEQVVVTAGLLCVFVAVISALTASSAAHVLRDAQHARARAEEAAAALDKVNGALEAQVAERTAKLQQVLGEAESRMAEQARLLEENEQQRQAIRELSVPVLPIDAHTLVMPLIGALDSQRLIDAQDQALGAIERTHARRLLLDITGVPVVDTQVAKGVIELVHAARLLGAQVVLVGIRPEVAQTVIGLGLDLRDIPTYADLQVALDRLVARA